MVFKSKGHGRSVFGSKKYGSWITCLIKLSAWSHCVSKQSSANSADLTSTSTGSNKWMKSTSVPFSNWGSCGLTWVNQAEISWLTTSRTSSLSSQRPCSSSVPIWVGFSAVSFTLLASRLYAACLTSAFVSRHLSIIFSRVTLFSPICSIQVRRTLSLSSVSNPIT